jgi:hypothetical protein
MKKYKKQIEDQFVLEDYEDYEQTRRFLLQEEPINLHATCLLMKCISKLLTMLRDDLEAALSKGEKVNQK